MDSRRLEADTLDGYAKAAEASWGETPAWAEYEHRRAGKTQADEAAAGRRLMELFAPFGRMAGEGADPACAEAQSQVAAVQDFITQSFYTCTDEILAQLGHAYGCGGDFTRNIDASAGAGAAAFAAAAIEAYCAKA